MAEKKRRAIGGTRKVIELGGSLAVTLPPEFTRAHNVAAGDDLPYAANHLLKFIPMPEEPDEGLEEELLETQELNYNDIVPASQRIAIPSGKDPVRAYMDGCDPLYDQLKKLYPDYKVNDVDMVTVNIEGQKYYQPGRIVIQRIRGKIVPPIEE